MHEERGIERAREQKDMECMHAARAYNALVAIVDTSSPSTWSNSHSSVARGLLSIVLNRSVAAPPYTGYNVLALPARPSQ